MALHHGPTVLAAMLLFVLLVVAQTTAVITETGSLEGARIASTAFFAIGGVTMWFVEPILVVDALGLRLRMRAGWHSAYVRWADLDDVGTDVRPMAKAGWSAHITLDPAISWGTSNLANTVGSAVWAGGISVHGWRRGRAQGISDLIDDLWHGRVGDRRTAR